MAGIETVTAAADEPLGLTEVKDYLRLDDQVDDNFVRTFIIAAREWAENYTNRAFITRTLRFHIDGVREANRDLWEGGKVGPYQTFYKNFIEIPHPPLIAVSSVKYFDDSDNESTWATSNYYVDSIRQPARIVLRDGGTFPTDLRNANGIQVNYTAGYGSTPSDVPEAIRVAMLQYCLFLYEHRGDFERYPAPAMPNSIRQLLQPYQIMRFGDHPYNKGYAVGIA